LLEPLIVICKDTQEARLGESLLIPTTKISLGLASQSKPRKTWEPPIISMKLIKHNSNLILQEVPNSLMNAKLNPSGLGFLLPSLSRTTFSISPSSKLATNFLFAPPITSKREPHQASTSPTKLMMYEL